MKCGSSSVPPPVWFCDGYLVDRGVHGGIHLVHQYTTIYNINATIYNMNGLLVAKKGDRFDVLAMGPSSAQTEPIYQ